MSENDYELMQIDSDEEFLKNYRAIYNAMTAKPDCRSKAYPKDVVIDLSDIYELNERIFEKFRTQYENEGFSVNIIVSIKGREKLEFPDWQSFETHRWVETEIITGIVLIWEFNVKLPKYRLPEKHTLTVKLSNGIRPEEMFGLLLSGKLDEIEEIDQNICPIVARMDFIDTGIGNEVLEIVSSWVAGLKISGIEREKCFKFLQKNKRKIAYLLNYLSLFIAVCCSLFVIDKFLLNLHVQTVGAIEIGQACNLINLLFGCLVLCFSVGKMSELVSNVIFKTLSEYGNSHIFNITKGDQNQQVKFRQEEKRDKKRIIGNLVISATINIICGVVTFFVTKDM